MESEHISELGLNSMNNSPMYCKEFLVMVKMLTLLTMRGNYSCKDNTNKESGVLQLVLNFSSCQNVVNYEPGAIIIRDIIHFDFVF